MALVNATLTFPAGSPQGTEECAIVEVVGDLFIEGDDTFGVDIAAVNDNDDIATRRFRVMIINEATDSKSPN